MNILVVNAGSSSLKFKLIESESEKVLARGLYDGLSDGNTECRREITVGDTPVVDTAPFGTHEESLDDLIESVREFGVAATGHRVVHGGEMFSTTVRVDNAVLTDLKTIGYLAPLHNPINTSCLEMAMARLPGAAHYAVFDTAFHQTMPESAYLYGLPYRLYRERGIRKYGFHGTNHKYVALRAADILRRPITGLRIITCHLGNGQSICAVRGGESIDTTMGFTPLEGLPMGTRSGSFDPEILLLLLKTGYTPDQAGELINRESGLLGLSGISSDYRTIMERAEKGDTAARRTHDIMVHRITGYIGSYMAEMGGVDAVVFTGGIGEHAPGLRRDILAHFGFAGLLLDEERNCSGINLISAQASRIACLVIPANEELQIVREVIAAMEGA